MNGEGRENRTRGRGDVDDTAIVLFSHVFPGSLGDAHGAPGGREGEGEWGNEFGEWNEI